jgi:3-methyl-2-oxobutanoate hydroxymethyltransferase
VLVFHDVLGLESRVPPKFVRQYASLMTNAVTGLRAWAADVRSGAFPSDAETYHITRDVAASLASA